MNPSTLWSDPTGKQWNCFISLAAARRLKQTQELDLLDPRSVDILFGVDPLATIEALAELTREQWTDAGLEYEAFADLVVSGEETFAAASEALKAGLADFFRRLGRGDLATVADRAWEAIAAEKQLRSAKAGGEKIGEILAESIRRTESEIDVALEQALSSVKTPVGRPFGNSPQLPGLTGDR